MFTYIIILAWLAAQAVSARFVMYLDEYVVFISYHAVNLAACQ
jgi:hypothetical protein